MTCFLCSPNPQWNSSHKFDEYHISYIDNKVQTITIETILPGYCLVFNIKMELTIWSLDHTIFL